MSELCFVALPRLESYAGNNLWRNKATPLSKTSSIIGLANYRELGEEKVEVGHQQCIATKTDYGMTYSMYGSNVQIAVTFSFYFGHLFWTLKYY